MAVGLWLALYILARGYRSRITRLSFVILFCVALFFTNAFQNVFEQVSGSAAWRAVLLIVAMFFWVDMTRLLIPRGPRRRSVWVRWVLLALAVVTSGLLLTPNAFRGEVGNAFNIARMEIGIPFLAYGLYMLLIAVVVLYNHAQIRKAGRGRSYRLFYTASLLVVFNIGHGILSLAILTPQSRIIQDGLILAAIIVLGYSVARHQTFVERRTSFSDFQLSALGVLGLAAVVGLLGLLLGFSARDAGLMVGLAVLVLGGYDLIRLLTDKLVDRPVSQMRLELRQAAQGMDDSSLSSERLRKGLAALCRSLEAEGGLIAVESDTGLRIRASHRSLPEDQIIELGVEIEAELIDGRVVDDSLAWIAPCIWQGQRLGLVGLGQRERGGTHNEGDLDVLSEFADQITLLLHLESLQSTQQRELTEMAATYQSNRVKLESGNESIVQNLVEPPDTALVKWVEEGLRHLSDYSYLGRSSLADYLGTEGETHLMRGRALREQLGELIDTLRPAAERPPEPLPREWYSFAILHDAYVEDVPNKEIMARLYISEGTFNRTRRKAVRSLARSVAEIR
jgi:hypothetical protein